MLCSIYAYLAFVVLFSGGTSAIPTPSLLRPVKVGDIVHIAPVQTTSKIASNFPNEKIPHIVLDRGSHGTGGLVVAPVATEAGHHFDHYMPSSGMHPDLKGDIHIGSHVLANERDIHPVTASQSPRKNIGMAHVHSIKEAKNLVHAHQDAHDALHKAARAHTRAGEAYHKLAETHKAMAASSLSRDPTAAGDHLRVAEENKEHAEKHKAWSINLKRQADVHFHKALSVKGPNEQAYKDAKEISHKANKSFKYANRSREQAESNFPHRRS